MSSNLITSFKTFYNNYINEATSVTFNPFSNKIEVNGQQSTQNISLIEPLFTLRALAGNKTSDLTANLLHRTASIFYGYNVVTPEGQKDKSLRNRIYATFKGINDPSYGEYGDKDWTDITRRIPLTIEHYNDIVDTAVKEFVEKTAPKSYSTVLYMQSRSAHVFDIAKRIFNALPENRKAPNCKVVEFKKMSDEKMIQNIEKVFNIEGFIDPKTDKYIEGFADNCIKLIPDDWVKDSETRFIIVSDISKYVKNVLNRKVRELKKGEGLSVASHIRSLSNKDLANGALNYIKKENPKLNISVNELPLNGHFDKYQINSHYDFESIIAALDISKNVTSNPEILIVDDNTNTGDTFKQINFILKDIKNKFGNTRIFNWNYFILMKDAEYADIKNISDDAIIARAIKIIQKNHLLSTRMQQLAAKELPGYTSPLEIKNTVNKVVSALKAYLEKEIQDNALKPEWLKVREINNLGHQVNNFIKKTSVEEILQNNNNDIKGTVKRLARMFKNKA
jgi:hypothetical protein